MPLTDLQRKVLHVIAANRGEESHFAVGMVLNSVESSARFSNDFDIFHDAEEEVAKASRRDIDDLRAQGFTVDEKVGDWSNPTSFRNAHLSYEGAQVEIDWAVDSGVSLFSL